MKVVNDLRKSIEKLIDKQGRRRVPRVFATSATKVTGFAPFAVLRHTKFHVIGKSKLDLKLQSIYYLSMGYKAVSITNETWMQRNASLEGPYISGPYISGTLAATTF